ncbi:MAG: biotin--[acetyl-CoA-carboxylase] ligase [Planctomycetota bacterium]|nr:biotin--[acetyl-CoA-carboxylase] ligase [Planctomycetota bacterium]
MFKQLLKSPNPVVNHGRRLVDSDLFPKSGLFFSPPEWLEEIDSTNAELKRRLASGYPPETGFVLAARRQKRGRGRLGNKWLTVDNRDLAFSFLWEVGADFETVGTLPMACALGICDFLASPGLEIAARCRWPNDVMTEKGKLAGILTEAFRTESRIGLIVGIGLNAAESAKRDRRIREAAAIGDFVDDCPGQEEILAKLLPFLAGRLSIWTRKGFSALKPDLESRLGNVGLPVRVRNAGGVMTGRISGLGDRGELLLDSESGTTVATSLAAIDWIEA